MKNHPFQPLYGKKGVEPSSNAAPNKDVFKEIEERNIERAKKKAKKTSAKAPSEKSPVIKQALPIVPSKTLGQLGILPSNTKTLILIVIIILVLLIMAVFAYRQYQQEQKILRLRRRLKRLM